MYPVCTYTVYQQLRIPCCRRGFSRTQVARSEFTDLSHVRRVCVYHACCKRYIQLDNDLIKMVLWTSFNNSQRYVLTMHLVWTFSQKHAFGHAIWCEGLKRAIMF